MTNGKIWQDAMGMIDEAYIAEVIEHRPTRSRLAGRLIRWGSLAACLVLIAGLGFGRLHTKSSTDEALNMESGLPPVDPDQILWEQESDTSAFLSGSMAADTSDSMALMTLNGWKLSGGLYLALQEADRDTYIAILVRRSYDYTARMNFTYQGKTRAQWQVEHDILQTQQRKLGEFSKEGQLLKYGEALYTTGTPDGERWTRALYEERVDFYGEYFISQYTLNGELLSDKIEQEMTYNEARLAELSKILVDLNDAYIEQNAREDLRKFASKDVYCTLKNGSLYLFVTKDELKGLRVANKAKYMLHLANRNTFEYEEGMTAIPIDETVTGFDCTKLTFYTDGVRYSTVSSDAEALEAFRYLAERWQYTADSVTLEIHSTPQLTEEQLAGMRHSTVYFSPNSSLIILNVKMKDLDPTAIRDLSLLPQVTSIYIGPPLFADHAG
ncbi:MAG: hypothetical protein IJW99_01425 [Clostridia bacterium]|nr:hypothetical protein [Clostridia bacterium]